MNRVVGPTIGVALIVCICAGCTLDPVPVGSGEMLIEISVGDEWLHDYPILGPISRPNPPTFAVWMTASADPLDFVGTVFVTAKMGNASWIRADDGRPAHSRADAELVRGGKPKENKKRKRREREKTK